VKLPDVNLLLYAADSTSPRHGPRPHMGGGDAYGRGDRRPRLDGPAGLLRLSTNPAVFEWPLGAEEALDLIDGWLERPCVTVVEPGERHSALLRGLLSAAGTAGNLIGDAHLAALAIEHGALLCSCDSDFSRFPGLRWVDPLRG
jgi:toxin-antitoxin system PIN domain toxin